MQEEIWKPIAGYEGYYEVSNLGRVKSLFFTQNSRWGKDTIKVKKEKIRKNVLNPVNGYYCLTITKDKKFKGYAIHRLVAIAFIPNPENKKEVNHIDGNKLNNSVTNLEWVTAKENTHHSINTGLNHGLTVIRLKAIEARIMKNKGYKSIQIQRELNISKSALCRILNNKTHIDYGKNNK